MGQLLIILYAIAYSTQAVNMFICFKEKNILGITGWMCCIIWTTCFILKK